MEISDQIISKINGEKIYSIKFTNKNNYSLNFYNFGGYIHKVLIPYKYDTSKTEDVILGYSDLEGCKNSKSYFNAIIGRVANRISNGKFELNNKEYNLYQNIPPHHLHGGKEGFNKRIWKIEKIENNNDLAICRMSYFSPHSEENYPGNLECKINYSLNNNNHFIINFEAVSDEDTIVNLTNHNYWNFHGHGKMYKNIANHNVFINSDNICEINKNSIPTGKLVSIKGTKFDLNKTVNISQKFLNEGGIDHNYELKNSNLSDLDGFIFSNLTGMGAEYYTDQPGMQLYLGNMMEKNYEGKYRKSYGLNFGICFEPQIFPDAINHSNFKTPILKKGETYQSTIVIKLRNDFI